MIEPSSSCFRWLLGLCEAKLKVAEDSLASAEEKLSIKKARSRLQCRVFEAPKRGITLSSFRVTEAYSA